MSPNDAHDEGHDANSDGIDVSDIASSPTRQWQPRLRWHKWRLRSLFILMFLVTIGILAVAAALWCYGFVVSVVPCTANTTAAVLRPCSQYSWVPVIFRAFKRWNTLETWRRVYAVVAVAVSSTLLRCVHRSGQSRRGICPEYVWAVWKIERLGGHIQVEEVRGNGVWISLGGDDKPQVTDADLECLEAFPRLYSFRLSGSQVTDTGLEHLRGATRLRFLSLSFTKVTDKGLLHLQGLTNLGQLDLDGTKVTDVGLVHLQGLKQLHTLRLGFTTVTDIGLGHLKDMTKLEQLYLSNTQITDTGLEHLKGRTQLQELDLQFTRVTDAGLRHLKGLTRLQNLYLANTQVTDKGVKELQQALPNCKIQR